MNAPSITISSLDHFTPDNFLVIFIIFTIR